MEIEFNYDYRAEDVNGFELERLAELTLRHEEVPESTAASVTFVTDERIHELNRDFRGIDRPTDVLSFECDGLDDGFDMPDAPDAGEDAFQLGDIFIAVDVAERQTAEFGTTLEEEVDLLMVHGLLHICGYDHLVDEEAEEMEALEQEILDQWKAQRVG